MILSDSIRGGGGGFHKRPRTRNPVFTVRILCNAVLSNTPQWLFLTPNVDQGSFCLFYWDSWKMYLCGSYKCAVVFIRLSYNWVTYLVEICLFLSATYLFVLYLLRYVCIYVVGVGIFICWVGWEQFTFLFIWFRCPISKTDCHASLY
jgi:hypothetical protein